MNGSAQPEQQGVMPESTDNDVREENSATMFERIRSFATIINVVLTYWVISISMVFVNKHLLGSGGTKSLEDDVSIFLAWSQCIICVLLIVMFRRTASLFSDKFQVYSIQPSVCIQKPILLVSFLFSMMLSSNNYCLKYVGIAFFQIARSFTLIFTVILSVLILRKRASWKVVMTCLVVVMGFFLGVDQEKAAGTLSVLGVMFGLTSSVFVALNGIFTKRALDIEDMSSVKLTLCTNTNATFLLFIPLLFSGQINTVILSGRLYSPWFWGANLLSGSLGFLIAWASNRQIGYTSPVTHHISNNTKSILQALLATMINGEHKTGLWWLGCCLVLLGAFLYAYIKLQENRQQERIVQINQPQMKSGV